MKPQSARCLRSRSLRVFIACSLSFSLIAMPFVPIVASMARAAERLGSRGPGDNSKTVTEKRGYAATNVPGPVPAPAPEPFAATIQATKTAALINDDGDGKADPGTSEKIEYTVTISNTGNADATNVAFTDTIDPHTTLVAGSVNTQPIADPDTYAASGNIQISVAAPGVLANDRDPDTGNNSGLTVSKVQGVAANVGVATDTTKAGVGGVKGSVTLNANGSFTYEPPPGYEGSGANADSFTYEISDGTKTDTATVTINITGMVWFINNTGGGSNRGTFTNPFTTIASFNTLNAAGAGVAPNPKNGDFISLRNGTGTYTETDGINLRAQQKLIGNAIQFNTVFTAAANSSSAYTTFASGTTSAPNIVTTGGNGIDLSTDNTVRGLNVGSTPGFFKFNGGAVGSPIINTVNLTGTGGALNVSTSGSFASNVLFGTFESTSSPAANLNLIGVTGTLGITSPGSGLSGSAASSAAVNVSGGSVAFSYTGSVTKANAGSLVSISGGHNGTVTFQTGTLSASAGDGLQFNNADGIYNFNGTTTLNGGDAGVDITSGSAGAFTFSSGTSITNPTGAAFLVSGGTAGITYGGTISQSSAARVIDVQNETGGTIAFNGAVSGGTSSTGVFLNSNTGATINFTGGVSLSTSTNDAFTATGGGTISATQNNTSIVNTLTTTSGQALNVTATTIGGSGLTFRSISSSGGTNNGITLDTTGAGGFTITGNGTAASGGTIQNKNGTDGNVAQGTGIYLNNLSGAISLTRMDIEGCQNYGIRGIGASGGLTIDNTTIGTVTKNGTSASADSEPTTLTTGEGSLRFRNLTGTVAFSNDSFDRGFARTVYIENQTAASTLTLNITNSTLRQSLNSSNGGDPSGNTTDAMLVRAISSATINLNVSGSHFTAYRQFGILMDARDTATLNVDIGTCDFSNENTGNVNASGSLNFGGSGAPGNDVLIKYNVHNNTFRHGSVATGTPTNGGAHIVSGGVSGGVKVEGKILNNTIGVTGVVSSGAGNAADALRLFASGNNANTTRVTGSTHTKYLVQGNTIKRYGETGIQFNARQGNSTIDATVLGNTINEPGTAAQGAFAAIWVNSGALPADTNQVNIAIGSTTAADKNTMQDSDPSNATDVFMDKNTCGGCASTLNLFRNGSAAGGTNEALIKNIIVDDNNPNLDLLNGFTNSSTIGVIAGLPPQVSLLRLPADNRRDHFAQLNDNPTHSDSLSAIAQAQASGPGNESQRLSSRITSAISSARLMVSSVFGSIASLVEPTAYAAEQPSAQSQILAATNLATANSSSVGSPVGDYAATAMRPNVKNQMRIRSNHASISRAIAAPFSGENINISIGTLRAGHSVTITFRVTVDNPPNLTLLNPPRVRNQGSVSFAEGATVLTDDPAVGGAADPTDTPVDLFDTSTTLASSLNPSNFGDQVTFTATIGETPVQGAVDPAGTVDFIDTSNGNTVICNDVAVTSHQAQCQTSTLTAGTHNIRADYSGDGNFDPSQSNVVAQVVIACTTNPVVTSTADSGAGTLREALANVCSDNTITFNLAGAGPHTITLTTGELVVGKNVTINNNSGEKITISGNNASRVFNINSGKTANIIGLTISGGSAASGAAVLNDGTLTLVNSLITGNNSSGGGGGIGNSATGILTLINTTISGNNAATSGGGISTDGTLTIINSTITNNTADSDNNASGTGGGIFVNAGTTTLKNTIVAGNLNADGGSGVADDISGTVDAASSFNLIGTGGSGGLTNGINNNQVGVANAGLGALADNGGLTFTHALLATSVAVEAGSNANLPADTFDLDGDTDTAEPLPVDQRGLGFPRNADSADANTTQTVDIGAFELHPSIEDIANQSTDEDTVKNVIFNIGDDTGSLIAMVVATSSNTTLVPNANLVITGSDGSRNLQITPAANQNGTTTITVTVTATNGRTATDTFDLTVNAVNDAPVANPDSYFTNEDTPLSVNASTGVLFNDTDIDTPAGSLTAILVSGPSNALSFTLNANGSFDYTPSANFNGTDSFTYKANDGSADSNVTTVTITVNPVNDAPTIQHNTGITVAEGSTNNTITSAMLLANDVDTPATQVVFTIGTAPVNGTLKKMGVGLAAGGTFTQDDINNNRITYDHDSSNTTSDSFTFTVSDGAGGSIGTTTFHITITPVNDAPSITAGGTLNYNENDAATAIDTTITVTDGDSPNQASATVQITGNYVNGQDVLSFTNTGTISGSFDAGMGKLTLTGSDTVANYQAALRSVKYNNTSDSPSTSPRTVSWIVNDGSLPSNTATSTINVTAVNDPPVNTVPGPQGTNQNTPLTFSSGNGNQISVADVDAGSNTVQVSLTATNGTLTLNGTAGLSFSFSDANGTGAGDGTADATMTFRGTIGNINTALNGMTFTPTLSFSGPASLTITTNDLGNTGSGGPLADTDVVNIQVATNVSIQDAQLVEPSSGSQNMIFTVTLSAPAPAGGSSVDFTTQQQPPAANHATAGQDYTTTSGTVNFAAGEQVKTILVPILSDNKNNEQNETFLVVLSNPVNATIADGTATGTILIANQPGTILISELRTSGPAGAGDDFVEIYNNSDLPHTVNGTGGGYGLFKMGASCSATPVLIGVIPNGTVIPKRGHFLFTGSTYSLADYGGPGAAAGDATLSQDIEDDRNVAIFSTTSLVGIGSANRLDAVGFGSNTGGVCDLFREGTTLTPTQGSVLEYSYFRDECGESGTPSNFGPCPTGGLVKDSNVNGDDFVFADTNATNTPMGRRLGAPGPQNLGSPHTTFDVPALLLDSTKGTAGSPNRVRDTTAIGPNADLGTMSIRRRLQNNTGAPVTRLRIRVVDISTAFTAGGTADMRLLSSGNVTVSVNDSATCSAAGFASTPCNVTVVGTTLETPPVQPLGGGFNSSATITLGTPLAPGASVNLQLLLGVQATGSFKFFFNVEALP